MSERGTMLDTMGACASALCGAHCLLAPVLSGLAVAGVEWLAHPACETGLRLVTTVMAGLALAQAARHRYGRRPSLVLFVAGLLLIWLGHLGFAREDKGWMGVTGGLTVAAAHLANRSFWRGCPPC